MSRIRIAFSIVFSLLVIAFLLVFVFQKPSNDRAWNESFARLATISPSDDGARITVNDIRDWTYDANGPVTKEYVNREYRVDSLTSMDFVLEPFPANPLFGHTFVVFNFSDAPPLAFSIEARMEEGEKYSGIKGLFNAYELSYTWGTERDFFTRRTLWLGHELYRYRLSIPATYVQAAFRAFTDGTAALMGRPRFYNTLLHNCTNELAHLVNQKAPGAFPWNPAFIFSGSADAYLYDLGFIKGNSFEEVKNAARIEAGNLP